MSLILNNNQIISLYLSRLIPILELRHKIINIKNNKEREEALEYHIDRWENISSKYFRSFEINQFNHRQPYSYIQNDEYYIAHADKNLEFYKETGISFQIRDMVLELVSYPTSNEWWLKGICKDSLINYSRSKFMKETDDRYGYLSKLIINKLKYI